MKVVIIADVSGSVDHAQLNTLLYPVMDALHDGGNEVWVVFGDTQVRAVFSARKVRRESHKLELIGHGGTDMAGVRREVMASMKPDYVLTLSDGHY